MGVVSGRRAFAAAAIAALVYLALHVPFLAWAPDDIDGTNFMLALRHFDLREHQPHPPGYPVFIAMAHVARVGVATVARFGAPLSPDIVSVYALAACSALFGALAVIPLVRLWLAVDGDPTRALFASTLAIVSPLFWYTGIRPLSDLPGLAVAVASLALVVPAALEQSVVRRGHHLFAGALVAGIAAGVRSQTLWVTGPALVAAVTLMLWRRDLRATVLAVAGLGLGIALWVLPFLVVAGGLRTYLELLTAQAASDLGGQILASHFSVRQAAFALRDTFVLPWGGPVLAVPVLLLAAVGAVRLLREKPRALLLIGVLFTPYLVLHLLFHSTNETRYAIPMVLPVAFFAARGLSPSTRPRQLAALALLVVAMVSSMGPVVSQSRSGSPLARAWADIRAALARTDVHPAIAMHHSVQRQLRFVTFDEPPLSAAPRYEWLAVVDHFRAGAHDPVWFLANARRSDLVLFDPAARRGVREYRWNFATTAVLGGVRPETVVWYEIGRPGWMAGEGWSLTPETRGVAERSRRSPGTSGSVAYLARRPEAATLMIGGRNLGGSCQTAALLQATLDGRPLGEWRIAAGEPFVFFTELTAGMLDGPQGYAELRLHASDLSGSGASVDVALEQFDVQSGRKPVVALAEGWYEPELDVETGQFWRWAGQRADMLVRSFGRDVVIGITADDPTRTLGRAVSLQVRAGGLVVASQQFDRRIEWEVSIPSGVIDRAGGRITLVSDGAFIPNPTQPGGDQRELAVRVFNLAVRFADEPAIVGEIVYPAARLVFDRSRPDGTPRKLLDVTRLHQPGWRHWIEPGDGIRSVYEWFVRNEARQLASPKRVAQPDVLNRASGGGTPPRTCAAAASRAGSG